jgi:RNA polymerase sigma-B factor
LLWRRFAATRDRQLRDEIIARYLPLARHVAGRYAHGSEPFDDLFQVACVALLKAVDRYDPERGIAFTSYALPTMTGELKRHFRDRTWAVRPPRDLQDQSLRVERIVQDFTHDRGRAPTVPEIAERADLDIEAVLEALQAAQARDGVSLDAPARGDEEDDTVGHRIGDLDGGFAGAEDRGTISQLSRSLTERERTVLRLRFEQDLTQAEIGELVGVSQMHASRIIRGAVDKLRVIADHTA